MTTIGDVTTRVETRNPSRSGSATIDYIDLSAVDNVSKTITAGPAITAADAPSRARQVVRAGDILVSTVRPNLNAVAVVPASLDGAIASTGFTVLRPADRVDGRYLFHWVQTSQFISDMVRKATGASYPAVSDRIIKSSHLPLPDTDKQRYVSGILDRASDLRARRRAGIAVLDELTRSIFLSMFGDPVSARKPGQQRRLDEIAVIVTGNTPSRSDPENYGSHIEWIKSDNLGPVIAGQADEWLSATGQEIGRVARAGSVLVTCIAGSATSIGKCSLIDRDVAFNQQINAIVPGPGICGRFLLEQLRISPELVRAQSSGGMKGLVSKSRLAAVNVLVPEIASQRAFELCAVEVDRMRTHMLSSLDELDELTQSFQSRSFSG